MNPLEKSSPEAVHAAVLASGHSYASFARDRGLSHNLVKNVVHRFAGKGTRPRGPETYKVLMELARLLAGQGGGNG